MLGEARARVSEGAKRKDHDDDDDGGGGGATLLALSLLSMRGPQTPAISFLPASKVTSAVQSLEQV